MKTEASLQRKKVNKTEDYLTLKTTQAGINMIIRTLYGDSITFTKIAIGDGKPTNLENVTDLTHKVLEFGLSAAESKENYMLLTGNITSRDVPVSFYGYELGVYAKGSDGVEKLYAYRYSKSDVDYYPSSSSGRTLELTMSIVIQIGNAQNVTAVLIEGDAYAKAEHKHDAADIETGVLPVERGGTGANTIYGSDLVKTRNITLLASAWSYSVPYTQTVAMEDITKECEPIMSYRMPDAVNAASIKAMKKAYSLIDDFVTEDGKITFYCYGGRPNINLNVCIKGV